jgi:para-nitrobenzyl esterase
MKIPPRLRRFVIRAFWIGLASGTALGIAILIVLSPPGPPQFAPPIRIESGLVKGVLGNGVTVYRGIPFAAPPVGALRWRAPQPVKPWSGVYAAYAFKRVCMQEGDTVPGLGREPMSEDCLYLNVWTPAKAPDEKRAVMVWLYGGGNVTGSGSARLYWGDPLARKGVIVVTLNYRLGVFGTLAHPELTREAGSTSGNYHLLDEIAALQWVQRNIAAFGGDPGNVTLFGQSAGAHHASILMTSPLAKGLFRRVIAESGGAFAAPAHEMGMRRLVEAEHEGEAFAARAGANSLAELRQVPAGRLLAVPFRSRANIDGEVVPADIYDSYAAGAQAALPILIGYNADENEMPHEWPMWTWAHFQARQSTPVYFYHFRQAPPFGPFRRTGAGHGAELLYVFDYPPAILHYVVEWPWRARRHSELSDQIRSYWTNFAKSGDPNGAALPRWPAFNDGEKVLALGDVITVADMPDRTRHLQMDAIMARLRRTGTGGGE